MKNTVLNLLTVLVLVAIVVFCLILAVLFINPNSPINPFPPGKLPELLVLPTATATERQLPTFEDLPDVFPPTSTQAIAQLPTLRPSSTPLPTFTSFVLPSATPSNTPTKTPTETPEATATSELYQCSIIYSQPNGATFPPGGDFDGKWNLRNTGTQQWSDEFDWVFVSGDRFQVSADVVDLNQYINPGNDVTFIVDMIAPNQPGTYKAKWSLRTNQNLFFCESEITLTVR